MYNVPNELQPAISQRILENGVCNRSVPLGFAITRSLGGVVRWGFVSIAPMGIS
jgi:hypothetical protein